MKGACAAAAILVFGRGEDFGEVARVGQLLPRFHLHQVGAGAGDEGRVRGGGDLGHFAEQFDIGRALVEVVVADQSAEGFAAELAVFFFVDLLEQRALVPGGALEALEVLGQLLLGDVHDADFQVLVGLGVVDHVVQAAPGAFELLKFAVVEDLVDLLGELFVDGGDHGLDRLDHVLADELGLRQRLLRQREHGFFDGAFDFLAARLELFFQQRGEVAALVFDIGDGAGGLGLCFCHGSVP